MSMSMLMVVVVVFVVVVPNGCVFFRRVQKGQRDEVNFYLFNTQFGDR